MTGAQRARTGRTSPPRSRRAPRLAALLAAAMVLAQGAAFAANEPILESTFPLTDGTARSADAEVIHARFDRPLNEETSRFELRDQFNNVVAGVTFLSEPPGNIKGMRQINFRSDAPLTEAASPYTARVHAHARVTLHSTEFQWVFSIDDTAPAAPVVTDPLTGQKRNDQPLVVVGTGEPGARAIVIEGGGIIAQATVNIDGDFQVFLPYPPEDGVFHTFEVFQTDLAGNTSAGTGPITIYHDSILVIPVITRPAEGSFVNTTTVTVSGTAKPNTSVRVREGGIIGITAADGDGRWTIDIVFAAGPHSITAESWDGMMLDGPSAARAFTVDLSAPAAPVITSPTPGQMLATNDVTIRGTAEPLSTVRIRHEGIIRATIAVDASGDWEVTLPFAEGGHAIEAWAVDRAGNVGASLVRSFWVDTVAPPAPTITMPVQGAFINVNNVTIAGDAEPFATVRVRVGTVVVGTGVANGGGNWSVNVTFPDGAHGVTAVAVDGAGNVSPPTGLRSFTVDTVAPAAPSIQTPAEGSTATTSPVTVTGTAEPAATVQVWEGVVLGSAVADAGGNWSVDIAFPNGPHAIRARAIDLAGNVGPDSPLRSFGVTVVVDLVPPAVPVLTDPIQNSLQPGLVIFRGSAEPGSTVRIFEGATPIANGTAVGGTFRLGAPLPTGSHTVTATATDAAGNVSAATAPRTFTVDANRPTLTVHTPNGSIFLPFQSVQIKGTAADNNGVGLIELEYRDVTGTLIVTETAFCTGCPSTPVVWEDLPTLGPGTYDVTIFAVDVVGNRSHPKTISIVVV